MANEKLQKILAMSKNMDKKASKLQTQPTQRSVLKTPTSLNEQIANADKAVANIDAMYNSPYIPSKEEKEAWNTEKGREELTEMANSAIFNEKLKHSRLPSAILESMRQNPCNLDATIVNKMLGPENELFKKLNEAYGKEKEEPVRGVKAVQQINEQLEIRDKDKNVEFEEIPYDPQRTGKLNEGLESIIEAVVERVIDRKLNSLNESISRHNPTIKSMSLTESGNFRFLDSEDNVYECSMKYIGKRKKKK